MVSSFYNTGVGAFAVRTLFQQRAASRSFPATCSNDHWLMGVSDVMILVHAIVQMGSPLELKEFTSRNARSESLSPAPTKLRAALCER